MPESRRRQTAVPHADLVRLFALFNAGRHAEMEAAALFLICMRERAKGRPVRAGCILTVSDVIRDEAAEAAVGHEAWYRPPEDEVTRRVDLTIGAALAAASALGRGSA